MSETGVRVLQTNKGDGRVILNHVYSVQLLRARYLTVLILPCPLSLPPPLPRITHAATHISLLSHVTSRPRTRVLVWPAQRSPAHCPRSRGWASHHSRLRAQSAAAAAAAFCQPPRGRSVLSGSFCADAMSAWLGLSAGLGLGLGPGSVIRVRVRVSGQWEGEVAVGL